MSAVLDASALLAYLQDEPGKGKIEQILKNAKISCVNAAEVFSKLSDAGIGETEVRTMIDLVGVELVNFDGAQAWRTGALRSTTRHRGLSLGDRACIALAMSEKAPAITTDRAWLELGLDVDIRCVR